MSRRPKTQDLHTARWILSWGRGQYLRLLFLILSNAAGALVSVWFALVCRSIVDSATGRNYEALVQSAVLLLVLIVGDITLGLAEQAVREYVLAKLRLIFQDRILKILLNREYSAVAKYHSGELLNRMFSDVRVVENGIVSILPSAAYLIFRLVGAAVVLIVLAPQFTLLFLAAGVVICLVMTLLRGKLKYMHKAVQEAEGKVRSFLQDTLERLLVIKVFGAGEPVRQKAAAYQNDYFRARLRRRAVNIAAGAGFGLIFQLGYFLAMVWGCFGIFYGTMTYGTLTAMLQLVNQIQSPFSGFSSLISQTYSVLASAERIMELEDMPEEHASSPLGRDELYKRFRGLYFDHVGFTYGRSQVLTDVSFSIEKGDFVSLTGLSGGGKSTLFLLMLGAYRAGDGRISFRFNGEPDDLGPDKSTRDLFAYVPQGNHLLAGTLRENVTFFKPGIQDEDIWQALRVACAEDFVSELPEKLDTMLGEKGHGLSEGQMQRIALARAVLSGAPILLLDEATSALDEETEAQLLGNLAGLKNCTCVIVTHRKAALAICNRHLYLRDGTLTSNPLPS